MADTCTVERSATIDAPPARVYDQVADFHHWTAWSPWEGVDPEIERTYSGAESGTGAVYGWSGNRKAGKGRMAIVDARVHHPAAGVRVTRHLVDDGAADARDEGDGGRQVNGRAARPGLREGLARLKATTEQTAAS